MAENQSVFSSGFVYYYCGTIMLADWYQIPVYKDFSLALFHDAGSVSKNFSDMQWRHGSGFGVRWFNPVAPFAFDLAYGHHDKKWRWSISLGTKF